jgi:hypothetical protein
MTLHKDPSNTVRHRVGPVERRIFSVPSPVRPHRLIGTVAQVDGSASLVAVLVVRDVAATVEACLRSLEPVVRAFCVIDTGSTDDTVDVIDGALAGRTGTIHRLRGSDAAADRNAALEFARGWGTHALVIRPDERLVVHPGETAASLLAQVNADVHPVRVAALDSDGDEWRWQRPRIVSTSATVRYRGVVDPFLDLGDDHRVGRELVGAHLERSHAEASANDAERQAVLLRRAILDRPDPELRRRYAYTLGRVLQAADRPWPALLAHEERLRLGGWVQEVYCSLLHAGDLRARLGRPAGEVLECYSRAEEMLPQRAEAPFRLGVAERRLGRHAEAVAAFSRAADAVEPPGALDLENPIYDHRALTELIRAAVESGDGDQADEALRRLERRRDVPDRVLAAARSSIDA